MLATFPVPILSVTAEAVRDLQGQDALYSLWTVFAKCKESVQDGRRLENISWRLWYRELIQAQAACQPSTPELATPHPRDGRSRSSYFPAHTSAKVSPRLLSSGLPSPSDQASPSPSPPPTPTMVPPSTPERPRVSPHSPGSTASLSSFTRGKSTPCAGRLIVDMLPNQIFIPQRKSASATTTTAVSSTPPPTVQSSRPCELSVPLVQLPASAQVPFPRVVVVNPTPHPTPPTTPVLHDHTPGGSQPPSTFLLPPLPPPALRPTVPSTEAQPCRLQPSPSLTPQEPSSSHIPGRTADPGSLARQPDHYFFLPPEDTSAEGGDGSTASGKSPSDLFEASSAASSQVKSVLTDVDTDEDNKEDQEEEEEDDRRSTTAAAGATARLPAHGRQNKPKRGKEAGKRSQVKRSHSAKHVALSVARKLSVQQQHPQSERVEKKCAMFNIGSGSSNGSRSATGSTDKAQAKPPPAANGFTFTTIQPSKVSPPLAQPPVIPNGFANGHITAGNGAFHGNTNANGSIKANTTGNVNGNTNANAQSRKTIVVASMSSEEYETTDGEDSEEWASEEMDAEDKGREAEETRFREAALEAQRQRGLFAKVPKRSYSSLNRTQSGLLSQLMNPNPAIFPSNHPYRISRSSADISRQYQQPQQRMPVPQRSISAYAPPRLSTSKSAAALPMAAQITAISCSRPSPSSTTKPQGGEKNGYRRKGPPKEQEMEDDSGDDADDKIQMSQSVAQQRLQALMSRRSSEQGTSSHLIQPVAMEVGPGLLNSATAPIPFGHPYNLPAAAPPMTPRTTRRRMLKTELSESMRRQLLWERQVSSNTNPALAARRTSQGTSNLRPLTSTSSEGVRDTSTKNAGAQDRDEQRRRAMARNRSWADDYHYVGW